MFSIRAGCMISAAQQCEGSFVIVFFITHQMFSAGDRSGLQAGKFSTQALLLQSQAAKTRAECGLALSC